MLNVNELPDIFNCCSEQHLARAIDSCCIVSEELLSSKLLLISRILSLLENDKALITWTTSLAVKQFHEMFNSSIGLSVTIAFMSSTAVSSMLQLFILKTVNNSEVKFCDSLMLIFAVAFELV